MISLLAPLATVAAALSLPFGWAEDPLLQLHLGVDGSLRDIPVTSPPEAFTRTVCGDFDGDRVPDVATLEGTRVHIMLAPAAYEAQMLRVTQGSDLVALPGDGLDMLMVATTIGPAVLEWSEAGAFWDPVSLNLPGWGSVRRLRALETGHGIWLVGLEADDRTVHCAYANEARVTPSTQWTPSLPWTTPQAVLDFTLLDLDGDQAPELAMASATGMRLFPVPAHSGSSSATIPLPGLTDAHLVAIGSDTEVGQWLACVCASPAWGSAQQLVVVGAAGLVQTVALDHVGPVVGLTVGDYDLDGRDDLLMSRTTDWDLALLRWEGSGAPHFELSAEVSANAAFAPAVLLSSGIGADASTNLAQPGLADLDSDGDLDIAYPIRAERSLWVGREGSVVDHKTWMPTVELAPTAFGPAGAFLQDGERVLLPLRVPLAVDGSAAHATGVEVLAWTQPNKDTVMNLDLAHGEIFPLEGLGSGDLLDVQIRLTGHLASPTTATPHADDFDDILYVCTRLVRHDAAVQEVLERFPARLIGIQARGPEHPNDDFLDSMSSTPPFELIDHEWWLLKLLGIEDETGDDEHDGTGHEVPCLPVGRGRVPTSG